MTTSNSEHSIASQFEKIFRAQGAADRNASKALMVWAANCPKIGEAMWKADYADPCRKALEKHMPASAKVILARVKVFFVGVSNGIGDPTLGLRPYYDAHRADVVKAGLLTETKRKPSAPGSKAAPTTGTTGNAAPKPEKPESVVTLHKTGRTVEDMNRAAIYLLGDEEAGRALAHLVTADKAKLVKFLGLMKVTPKTDKPS